MPTARGATLGVQLNGADPNPNPNRMSADYAWRDAAFDLSCDHTGSPDPDHIVGGPADGPNLLEWRQSGAPFGSVQTQFSVTAGALPPGLKLVQKEVRALAPGGFNPWPVGVLNEFGWAGVPTELGVFNVTIGASGAYPGGDFTWTISLLGPPAGPGGGGCSLITITPTTLDGDDEIFVGQPIAIALTAEDGAAPYVWDVAEGELPDGITLSAGGVLEGAATTAGVYNFTIRATDDNDCPGVIAYTLTVVDPDPIEVLPAAVHHRAQRFLERGSARATDQP